ncbi:MAG TPA: hypothetical protein VH590_01175 [Ktedonobacterales bacterium]|jgi:hypothetical protein
MRSAFVERWRVYVVWLSSGVSGILPDELRLTLGPVRASLPLARQVAETLGPWLAALLLARQQRGLPPLAAEDDWRLVGALPEESPERPFERRALRRSAGWLKWLLEAELRRLVRLAEAPEPTLRRRGWLAWEVRYWALAVSLARIGQLYAALEQKQPEQAERLFKGALALVWHQALHAGRAA